MRKTRLRPSPSAPGVEWQAHDFPVFLGNPNRTPPAPEEPPPAALDSRDRFSVLVAGATAKLTPYFDEAKSRSDQLRAHVSRLPNIWQDERVRKQAPRVALIAMLLPLAIVGAFGRVPAPMKPPLAVAQTPKIVSPDFDLDERLAFAQTFGERLLANAIALSLKSSTPPDGDTDPSKIADGPVVADSQTADRAASAVDTGNLYAPPVATDDRQWSLPFGGQNYVSADFPGTAQGSFMAAAIMSPMMIDKPQSATVAENDVQTAAPAPKAKRAKVAKRKRTAIQKRVPAKTNPTNTANQMTAAAQPVQAQSEPNLPPPPILFFLGAPPPPGQ